jgi:hypothetical protein
MATRVEHELGLSFGTWNGIKTAGKAAHFYFSPPFSTENGIQYCQ